MIKMHYIRLNNDVMMPIIGHGIAVNRQNEANNQRVLVGLKWALKHGHRMIDTAKYYDQDQLIAKAIKASGIARSELFITSKVWPDILGDEKKTDVWIKRSLADLETTYFDQLLLHFPTDEKTNVRGWKILEKYLENNITRSIGVSNYEVYDLRKLLPHCKHKPQVNQVEASLLYLSYHLLFECIKNEIQYVAYSPIARYKLQSGEYEGKDLRNELKKIANALGMTEIQAMLAYLLGKGIIPIVRSNTEAHIIENLEVLTKQNVFHLAATRLAHLQKASRTMGAPDAIDWKSLINQS